MSRTAISAGGRERRAGFRRRAGAAFIDLLLVPVVYGASIFAIYVAIAPVIFTGLVTEEMVSEEMLTATVAWVALIPTAGYFWLGNAFRGTIGKRVLGLRVVPAAGGADLGPRRALTRFVVSVAGVIPFGVGWLWFVWDGAGQAWHDKAAGSKVVRSGEP